jgi:hypothetical protein
MLDSPLALTVSVISALALMIPLGRFLEARDLAGFCSMEGGTPVVHGTPFTQDHWVDCRK